MLIFLSAYIIVSVLALIHYHWEEGLILNKSFFVHLVCVAFSSGIIVLSGIKFTNLAIQVSIMLCSLIIVAISLTYRKEKKIKAFKDIDLYRVGLLYQIYVVCTLNLIAMALI
jgi:hypothetical protein